MSSQFIATLHSKHIFWDSWDNIFFALRAATSYKKTEKYKKSVIFFKKVQVLIYGPAAVGTVCSWLSQSAPGLTNLVCTETADEGITILN